MWCHVPNFVSFNREIKERELLGMIDSNIITFLLLKLGNSFVSGWFLTSVLRVRRKGKKKKKQKREEFQRIQPVGWNLKET